MPTTSIQTLSDLCKKFDVYRSERRVTNTSVAVEVDFMRSEEKQHTAVERQEWSVGKDKDCD